MRRHQRIVQSLFGVLAVAVAAGFAWHGATGFSRDGRESVRPSVRRAARPGAPRAPLRTTTAPALWPQAADLKKIPTGRWERLAPAPRARTEVAAASLGEVAYIAGGFDASGHSSAAVDRLQLRTGRWSAGPPLPRPLNHASMISFDGALYVVGGYTNPGDTSSGATAEFWRLGPGDREWTPMPAAPVARAAAGAAVLGRRMYVAGGRSDLRDTVDTLAIFDFDSQRWTTGPPLRHAREHIAMAAAQGALYVLGGRARGQGDFADVERYIPGASRWQVRSSMPVPRAGFGAVAMDGRLVLVGGEGANGTIGQVDALDIRSGRWSQLAPLHGPRHGLGVIAAGPLVWALLGGAQPGLVTSTTAERLKLVP